MIDYEKHAKDLGVPLIPKRHINPQRRDFNDPVAVCGECGITLYRVMGYSCPQQNCPCGLGSSGSLCLNSNDTAFNGSMK